MAWHKPANLREWMGVFRRHHKKFFFTAGAVMIAVFAASFFIPREYRAEARFDRATDFALDSIGSGQTQRIIRPWRNRLKEDLSGKQTVEQLVEDLKLTTGLPHNADGSLTREGQLLKSQVVEDIRSRLEVPKPSYSNELDQMRIVYTDRNRELAPRVVNTIVENYIRNANIKFDEALLNAEAYFSKQADRYKTEVSRLDKLKVQFAIDHPGLEPTDPMSVSNMLTTRRAELDRVTQELDSSRSQKAKQEEWYKTLPDEVVHTSTKENPEYTLKFQQLSDLEKELNNHLFYWNRTEEHPLVKKCRERIAQIKKELDAMQKDVDGNELRQPNQVKIAAKGEIERLAGVIESLERRHAELNSEIDQWLNTQRNYIVIRNQYNDMNREYDEAVTQRDFWERALNNTRQTLQAQIASRGQRLSFTSRAEVAKASWPTLWKIILAALVAGLGAGAVMIFVSELLDHSFRTVDQAIEELKLPVLGSVTEITTSGQAMRRKLLSFGVYPALGVAMVLILLAAFYFTWLDLEQPQRFERLRRSVAGGEVETRMARN